MALAGGLSQTDPLENVLVKVVGNFRHKSGQSAHSHAGVQGDVTAAAAHYLHHAAAVVRLGGVADAVDHFHGGIQSGVVANGVIGAGDVIVNGARHANGENALAGQVPRAAEGAVTADDNYAVDALFPADSRCLFHALGSIELRAAGSKQGRAAMLHNVGHAAHVHFLQVSIEQAVIAPHDAVNLHAKVQAGTDHCPHCRVHARSVAAAGQYCNIFRTHCQFLQLFKMGFSTPK